MESKQTKKTKSPMKRRKTSSFSDHSTGSQSPSKKSVYHDLSEDYRSSPEITTYVPSNTTPRTVFNYHRIGHEPNLHAIRMPSSNNHHMPNGSHTSDNDDSISHNERPRHRDSGVNGVDSDSSVSSGQRPRTTEDFYRFCRFILEYENYISAHDQENLRDSNHSPLDSTGSATESIASTPSNEESNHTASPINAETETDVRELDETAEAQKDDTAKSIDASSANEDEDDATSIDPDQYNMVTCYCGKPYAARPMIECSKCLTWVHLFCAKIKRRHIPDIFICVKCNTNGAGEQQQHAKETIDLNKPTIKGEHQPKENSLAKSTSPQTRSDKGENNVLQPLNGSFETGANKLDSKTSSLNVKYK